MQLLLGSKLFKSFPFTQSLPKANENSVGSIFPAFFSPPSIAAPQNPDTLSTLAVTQIQREASMHLLLLLHEKLFLQIVAELTPFSPLSLLKSSSQGEHPYYFPPCTFPIPFPVFSSHLTYCIFHLLLLSFSDSLILAIISIRTKTS